MLNFLKPTFQEKQYSEAKSKENVQRNRSSKLLPGKYQILWNVLTLLYNSIISYNLFHISLT